MKVAIAKLPVREAIAAHRIHLHVGREEVATAMGAVLGDAVDKHLGVVALAHKAPVVVGESDNDGVDLFDRNPLA
jgi:hypothetical protein